MQLRFIVAIAIVLEMAMQPYLGPRARAGERDAEPSGPFCGVYSLYAAARIEDVPVDIRPLLTRQYVTSPEGSSLADLRRAAESLGLHATVMRNLDVASLRAARFPIVLHVKDEPDSSAYNHFVVFVPAKTGGCIIYDPPGRLRRTSGHDLAPM